MVERKDKEDLFGTQKKLPLGPCDYNVSVDLTKKSKSPSLGFVSKSAVKVLDDE